MGSKKVKKAKKMDVNPHNDFESFLRRLRSMMGSSTDFFKYLFWKSDRVRHIRDKYRHQQKRDAKSFKSILRGYLKIAAEGLYLPKIVEWVHQLVTKIRLPKIKIFWIRQIKLPRMTISNITWPRMLQLNLLYLKAIKLLKIYRPSFAGLKLPKLQFQLPKIIIPKLPSFKVSNVNFPEFKSLKLPTINLSWLKSLKLPSSNLSKLKSVKLPSINWSKLKFINFPSINLSKLKSLKLPTINVSGIKSLELPAIDWSRLKSVKLPRLKLPSLKALNPSGASVLQGLNVTLPELTWVVLGAERIPKFVPVLALQKLAGLKIPKLERPTLPIISELSLRKINPAGPGRINLQAVALGLLLLSYSWFPIYDNMPVPAYALQIDGQTVAFSADKTVAEKVVAALKEEKTQMLQRRVDVAGDIKFVEVKTARGQLEGPDDLRELLSKKLSFVAVATGIKVNGELAVAVSNEETAEIILKQLKDSYIKEGMQVDEVTFAEKVELVDVPVSLAAVISPEEALRIIKEGKQKKTVHIVESGESLWVIARNYNVRVEDLQKANPSIKGEHVDIGQEINLVAVEPLVNVQIVGELTVQETVPYKVTVETDRNLWRGTEKVKTAGENGLRVVTYRVLMQNGTVVNQDELKENILKPVTNKVVVRGSKIVVASRGGGGQIGWPISGRITSGYGSRWGRLHTGLDIGGVTGQPIGAAAAGQVVSVGYQGAYGKMITIRHDNGWVTRYAHLSQYKVSVGQKVERGDLIGLVGNTGRSTGSHLHFEVLINGKFQNPIKYLK